MKYISKFLLLFLILCLVCGCAPANVEPQTPQTPDSPQRPTDTTQNDPQPQADNLLLDKNAGKNGALLPRGITKEHNWIKTTSGNTLTFYYPAQSEAFSYSDGKKIIGESSWMRSLKTEYDITLHAVRKSPASSLAAQRLAMLSGIQLDLLAFTPSQLPYALNMTADASALLEKQSDGTDFLNTALLAYGGNGKRFFTPVGVARNLWYTKESGTSPLSLSESKQWDLTAFTNFVTSRTKLENGKVKVYGYEVQDFTDLLAALGTPLLSLNTTFTDGTAAAQSHIKLLQQFNAVQGRYYSGATSGDQAPALAKKTLAMRYGRTPFVGDADTYPGFEWAPLPTATLNESQGTMSACAPILALPADGTKNEIALNAALLWTARFADANHDLLRFTYGLSFENWQKYYTATNELIRVVIAADTAQTKALLELITAAQWSDAKFADLQSGIAATVKANNERLSQ